MRPPKHRTRFLCFGGSSDPNLIRRRKSEMPNCKTIAICNQKGGVGILHELNPEEMEGAFQHHLTQRSKEKTA
jgi:hypothetical protein